MWIKQIFKVPSTLIDIIFLKAFILKKKIQEEK